MIGRALAVLAGSTLLGIFVGGFIGRAIGTVAPATYQSHIFGARSREAAIEMGTGFGVINGSVLGIVVGGLALLYDLAHGFLKTRRPQ